MKIGTLNCKGLAEEKKRRLQLASAKKKLDIYCLQEAHIQNSKREQARWKSQWGYEAFFSSFDSKSCGAIILFNNTFEYVLHNVISDQQGRYIILDISIFQQLCTLVTLYGPNTDSPEFFTNLKENLINWELSNEPIILCGDWNVVLNYHSDTINYLKENNPNAQKSVLELMDTFELDDVYRDQEPAGRSYTWSAYSNLKQARLDYFLVSTDLAALVESIQTCAGYRTDHSLAVMNMIFTHQERGRGFWKFNNSLLSDPAYDS